MIKKNPLADLPLVLLLAIAFGLFCGCLGVLFATGVSDILSHSGDDTTAIAQKTAAKGVGKRKDRHVVIVKVIAKRKIVIADFVAVDLGLPSGTLWADRNVGASSPEDNGDYFAWGETREKRVYTKDNSVTCGMSSSDLSSKGIIDRDGNLTAKYDAATANLGRKWHMPTHEQMRELCDICNLTWEVLNHVIGCRVTGPNGNSIFLPAAGYRAGNSLYHAAPEGYAPYEGYYWISTNRWDTRCLTITQKYFMDYHSASCYDGMPVRAVAYEPKANPDAKTADGSIK